MLATMLGVAASGVVHGQSLAFYAREQGASIARDDGAVAVATWADPEEPGDRWIFTAGWVTLNDGSGNPHKRLAVFKYAEESSNWPPPQDPPGPGYGLAEADAYFPPSTGAWTPVGQHAATDMQVDSEGNVYVTGYTTMESSGSDGSDLNYITIKYTKTLGTPTQTWNSGTAWGGIANARGYDGPAHGDDIPSSIAVIEGDGGAVVVTGTSDNGENDDIVTLRYDLDGDLYSGWSSTGEGDGIRRWHGGHGDDAAAEVGCFWIVQSEVPGLQTVLIGSSYQGATNLYDRVTLCYDPNGDTSGNPGWSHLYNSGSGRDDHGTGLGVIQDSPSETAVLLTCGHSEMNTSNPPDIDYVVFRYAPHDGSITTNGGWGPAFWDADDGQDLALDMALSEYQAGQVTHQFAWVTGVAQVDDSDKIGTVCFNAGTGAFIGADAWSYNAGQGNAGNSVTAFGLACQVAGTARLGITDTDVATLWYVVETTGPSVSRAGPAYFPGDASALPDFGLAITRTTTGDGVVVVGRSTYSSSYLTDVLTARISNP